jgi:hypothetical protein
MQISTQEEIQGSTDSRSGVRRNQGINNNKKMPLGYQPRNTNHDINPE